MAAAAAALLLYLRIERAGRAAVPLAVLRALAWGSVGLLLVNPSCRRSTEGRVTVLLDGSLSMSDATGVDRWLAAVDSARAAAGRSGTIIVFGAEPRLYSATTQPDAPTTLLLPALREAASRGAGTVIVTDGALDDAAGIPEDLLRSARVVLVPRPDVPDAGVAALLIPATLRAGDTAIATVDIAAAGTSAADTVLVELLEQGRRLATARVALGAGGTVRRDVPFVPSPAGGAGQVRRYEARVSGLARDGEPRDDARQTAAAVSQASAIALLSDAPDWDFRWLAQTLAATSGVPVRAFVRLGPTGWHDARTMRVVPDAAVRAEAGSAALVVAHGTREGVLAASRLGRRALWQWISVPARGDAPSSGDWYVVAPEFASPVGGALAGTPAESLPPLDMVLDLNSDSVTWTGLVAQLDRRGRSRPVIEGGTGGGRRRVILGIGGLWRWASRGGVAAEAYRATVASLTDWLIEDRAGAAPGLVALRDSLARTTAEFLPRPPALGAQDGIVRAGVGEPEPLRFTPWLYLAALIALVVEWVARRRRGMR